jgi:hypothetical protein
MLSAGTIETRGLMERLIDFRRSLFVVHSVRG